MKTYYSPDSITIEVDDVTKAVSLFFRDGNKITKINLTKATVVQLSNLERADLSQKEGK